MRWTVLLISLLTFACGDAKKPDSKAPASKAPASKAAASKAPASKAPATAAPKSAAPATRAAAVTVAPITISATLDEKQQTSRLTLATKILDKKLRGLALRNRRNAPIFLDLAARHPHPAVVAGALDAVARTFTHKPGKPNSVTEDVRKVLRVRLGAKNPTIRLAAIAATRLLLSGKPEVAFVDRLIELSQSDDAPTRYLACRQLAQLNVVQSGKAKDPIHTKTMTALHAAAKGAGPVALITIMERVARPMRATMPQFADFGALAKAHRGSADPGVRGAANLLFATTATDKAAAAKALVADLTHADPYVRGATIEALGLLGRAGAVHAIVKLLDDSASTVRMVQTEPKAFPLLLDYGRQVNDVALGAMRVLSKKRFDFERADLKKDPAAVMSAAKAWYKKAGKSLPAL